MTKKRSLKRAMLMSALSILLCISMLIGSTFAWFTDNVSTTNNIIQSGNLDVELYWSTDMANWEEVKEDTNVFSDRLWEPGHAEVVYLKVVNAGTLALNYQLGVNVASETGSVNVLGDDFKLSDHIKFGVVEVDQKYNTRDDAVAAVSDSAVKLNQGYSKANHLEADKEDKIVAMVVYMPTTVGNEANYAKNAPVPTINLGINLFATQYTHEQDSFDNNYDEFASVTVTHDGLTLAQAIAQVEDGGTIFVENGTYTINSMLVIEGKSLSIVGMGNVNITTTANQHMFTIQDQHDHESDMVVNLKNLNLDGKNVAKHGINVKYNVTVNMENVNVENTTWASVLLDNANKYSDGKFYDDTATRVNMVDCDLESVSLDALPVVETHSYADAGVDTYAYLNYDKNTTIDSIEVQSITKKPENIIINGVSADAIGTTMYFNVSNDAELAAALETIKTNSNYWNKEVVINMAAGEYKADHVINQYPGWNGTVGAGGSGNNYASGVPAGAPGTVITFVGETATTYGLRAVTSPAVVFTGNVTVNGFGNAGTGFGSAFAVTTFKNVAFDAANSVEANGEDYIVMYVQAAANNVTFENCTFLNATHVTLGGSGANGVGAVNVNGCTFNNGGCLSGYVETLNVTGCNATNASNGFIDKKKAGPVTVDNCTVDCSIYFLRTDNSGITVTVTNSTITETDVENSKGTGLVVFRGSGHTAKFTDCDLEYVSLKGGAGTGTIEIYNFSDVDGITYYTDGVSGARVLYLVPADYTGTTVKVADGTTAIGNYAFSYNSNVKTVELASTVRDLGRGFDSSTVEKVVLNEGLEIISSRAFRSTTNLKEVVISSTVTEIADNAFQKSGIKEIVIPANVKTIGETAFGASSIETVTFEGDIAIQGYAFRGCPNLRTVNMEGYNVTFVPSTLNGRNSMWFCNGESNNPNTSNITFNVKTTVIADRVKKAMGAEANNTPINVEYEASEGGYFVDDQGYAHAYDAQGLVAALENGEDVVLCDDTKIDPAGMSNAYGTTGINVKNGQTIDGNGNTLDIKGAGGTWDSGINTTGGVIKNLTVTGSFRGIFINHNSTYSEQVVLENVIIDGTTYTISCDQGMNQTLKATDCTFNGWTSFAATLGSAEFINCDFGEGNGYAYCRPYAPTNFVGCDFEAGFQLDARAKVTFENCTIGGVALTADNLATLVTSNIANAVVK